MFSEFKSFLFMGVPNSQACLSEKDMNSMEFNFLVRPAAIEFEDDERDIARLKDGDELNKKNEGVQEQKQKEEQKLEEDRCKFLVSTLEIKLPSLGEFKIEDDNNDDDDGLKTPTSLDHKIPAILQCPPAPRKPKSFPSTKRKLPRQRVLLDLSNEIESIFTPALLVDLGGKIKKVRQGNSKWEGTN